MPEMTIDRELIVGQQTRDNSAEDPSAGRERPRERSPLSERERFEIVGWDEA